MDRQMPVMDGYAATKEIRVWESRNNRKRTLIVALTANALKEERARAIDVGCDSYILKPVRKKQLLEFLHTLATKKAAA